MNNAKLLDQIQSGRLAKRFWPKVDMRGPDECWNWKACVTEYGYGRMTAGGGVNVKAPRASMMIATGNLIPDGMNVLHRCDNPSCVNPSHLFFGSQKENVRDAVSKGRNSKPPIKFGTAHPHSVLTEEQVNEIRSTDWKRGVQAKLARKFGVAQITVSRVRRGLARTNG